MELRSDNYDGAMLVTVLDNRIDSASAVAIKDEMRGLTNDGPDRVVVDMKKVEFVDSSGLGAIVAAMKQIGAERKLELAALSPTVDKVFRLTRMDTVFTIHADAGAAIGDLQPLN